MAKMVRVEGLSQLQKAMQDLGRKTSNRIAVQAMRKGGAIVRDKARANAPVLTENTPYRRAGTLRKAIQARTKIGKNGQTNTYVLVKGLSTKQILKFKGKTGKDSAYNPRDPFYWRFVEFGTSKMAARPFMRPAFEQSKEKAANVIIQSLKDGIMTETGK